MAFPLKYKSLLEIEKKDVSKPSHVWITYSVCAISKKSCGWILEGVFSNPKAKAGEDLLSSFSEQICPNCGKELFRTNASYRCDISKNQKSIVGVPGVDYTVVPMKYSKK